MMRSASRAASAALRPHKKAAIGAARSSDALVALADELYSVAALLIERPRLRRAVGHPGTPSEGRVQLLGGLLQGKVSPSALDIAKAAVGERWSSPWDLTDALETAGDDALFAAAERDGELAAVEDELFRFERILNGASQLTTLLDEAPIESARRLELLDDVLGDKVHPITKALLEHAIRSQRKRSIALAIDDLLEEAAARQAHSMARVISAIELTPEQLDRLATALSELYRRPITVRTAVDPSVRGGLVIRVGEEIIDGSVAAHLLAVRSALAA